MQEIGCSSLSSVASVLSRLVSVTIPLAPVRLAETSSCNTGTPEFEADISHWANSSSQVSACSVEPSTPHEVGLIVRKPHPHPHPPSSSLPFWTWPASAPGAREHSYEVRSQRWRAHFQPRFLVYSRRPHLDDPIQGYNDKHGVWDSRDGSGA
jgi:hypothetical protein